MGLLLGVSLITPIQAVTGAGSVGFYFPYGLSLGYEHNLNERGLGVNYATLSDDLGSVSVSVTSIGVTYIFYKKSMLKGWYSGPGISYRQLKAKFTTSWTEPVLLKKSFQVKYNVSNKTVEAEANIIDIYQTFGYSWLVFDLINIKLGATLGFYFGTYEDTEGTEMYITDRTNSIQISLGYAF